MRYLQGNSLKAFLSYEAEILDNEFSMHSHICLVLQHTRGVVNSVQLRHGSRTKKYINLWKVQPAHPAYNLHSTASNCSPICWGKYVRQHILAALRSDPKPALMPSQHKQISEIDYCSYISLPAAHLRFRISVIFFLFFSQRMVSKLPARA